MKAKIKLDGIEYFVDFNLRPTIINSVDKEVDEITIKNLVGSIRKYILQKYGKTVSDFYVIIKQPFIDYVNKTKEFRMLNILDKFNVEYGSSQQKTLYKMIYDLESRGYIERIRKGRYKLIKIVPNLKYENKRTKIC